MNWAALLGISGWTARWRALVSEGALAAEDRLALARLEWEGHRQHLAWLVLLLVLFGALLLVALLLLSAAVLVQFWDTPQRVTVAWSLAGVWGVACVLVLARIVSLARQARNVFALTRRELAQDWQALKGQLRD